MKSSFVPCSKCKVVENKPIGKPHYGRCGDEVSVAQRYRLTFDCPKCGRHVVEEIEVAD